MDKFKNKVLPVLLAGLFIINLFSLKKITNMSEEINRLRNDLRGIQDSIDSSINNGINDIVEIQRKDSSIITDFDYKFGELKDKRVDLKLSIKPKVINKNDKFFFSYKSEDNSQNLIEALSSDGINFESSINVPIFDSVELDFIIDDGNSKKTETLDPIYEPIEKFVAQLDSRDSGGEFRNSDKTIVFSINYVLSHFIGKNDGINIENPKLSFYKNDKLIETSNFKKGNQEGDISDIDTENYMIELKDHKLDVIPGDIILVQITTKDNNGFNYKINVDAWKIGESGGIDFMNHDGRTEYRLNELIIE